MPSLRYLSVQEKMSLLSFPYIWRSPFRVEVQKGLYVVWVGKMFRKSEIEREWIQWSGMNPSNTIDSFPLLFPEMMTAGTTVICQQCGIVPILNEWITPFKAQMLLFPPMHGEGPKVWNLSHAAQSTVTLCRITVWKAILNYLKRKGNWNTFSFPFQSTLPENGIRNGAPGEKESSEIQEFRTVGFNFESFGLHLKIENEFWVIVKMVSAILLHPWGIFNIERI